MTSHANNVVSRSMVIWFILGVSAAWAGPMEFDLYDATPEPGRPLSWSVNVYHDHDDHGNFGWSEKIDCTLTEKPINPLVKEYTFTPAKPGRYLLMPTIRVDGWRMVDDRSFWIDSRNVKTPRPFTFRCVLKQNQRGPDGTGNTTVLQSETGTLMVHIETGQCGNIFPAGTPMSYTVSLE
ncbi:MAG: hypothetical protein JXM70_24945, partial [Pirellulales bacterium]|nr:hypothetical protein [Pirellulales bacterium]